MSNLCRIFVHYQFIKIGSVSSKTLPLNQIKLCV
jgi:hypothetical protein